MWKIQGWVLKSTERARWPDAIALLIDSISRRA
jgi:hypothetical protein